MKDLHKIWPHRWVARKVRVFSSKIEGRGVVAINDIKRGEVILVYGGVIVPESDWKKYEGELGQYGIQISDGFHICPTTEKELDETGVVNHSCEPTAGFADALTLVAIRKIRKGEEITIDYAFCESYPFMIKCNCGSRACRGVITGNDWKIKKLQQRYGSYFSPYLKKRFITGRAKRDSR